MLLGNASSQARIRITAEDRTAAGLNSVQRNLGGVGAAARNVAGLITGIGATAALLAIKNVVRSTADYADEMTKLGQRAGVTTEAISALAFAARLNDVDNNTLARGLRELGKDAADGGKKLAELGIAINDAGGKAKTSDALLLEFADVIASIEEPAKRAAAASKLLGERAGPELIPLLAGGSAALIAARLEAEKFGQVISTDIGLAAVEFNDNLTRIGEAASGLGIKIANNLLPVLNEALKALLALPEKVSLAGLASDVLSLDKQLKALESRKAGPFNFAGNLQEQIASTKKQLAEARQVFNAADTGRPASAGGGRGFLNPALAVPTPVAPITDQEKKRLAEEEKRQREAAQRLFAESKKTEEDFQVFLRGFDNASFDYKSNLNSKLLSEKEQQEADHQDFLRGFDDARYDYLADRNEKRLQAEADAARANELAIQDFSQTLYGDVKGALSDAFRDTKDPIRAFGDALANVVFTRVSSGLATSIADGLLGKAGVGGGILSGLTSKLFSFDGGGYTGAGPRSGGMDGRGGFMAMVHPNETVVDHTKGQRAGGTVYNITIPTSIGDISSKADVVAGMQTVRAQILGELQRSSRYGGAMA
jgi:hypothetical protein